MVTSIALIVGFVLHVIAFFLIILLFLRISKIQEVEKRQIQLMKDMENAVSAYLLELKDENERFLTKLSNAVNQINEEPGDLTYGKKNDSNREPGNDAELPSYFPNVDEVKDRLEIVGAQPETPQIEGEMTEKQVDSIVEEQSVLQQAVALYAEGKSIEEIARILAKGKTEIELLLKFRQM